MANESACTHRMMEHTHSHSRKHLAIEPTISLTSTYAVTANSLHPRLYQTTHKTWHQSHKLPAGLPCPEHKRSSQPLRCQGGIFPPQNFIPSTTSTQHLRSTKSNTSSEPAYQRNSTPTWNPPTTPATNRDNNRPTPNDNRKLKCHQRHHYSHFNISLILPRHPPPPACLG